MKLGNIGRCRQYFVGRSHSIVRTPWLSGTEGYTDLIWGREAGQETGRKEPRQFASNPQETYNRDTPVDNVLAHRVHTNVCGVSDENVL